MKCRLLSLIFLVATANINAQLSPEVISIPMRDGKSLAADLYRPSQQGTYPVILIQTPYNKNTFRLGLPLNVGQDIATSPFAFVVLDWRCFYASGGACAVGSSRGEDGYDAVEWIAAQSWCSGRIGTWGPSALANIQFSTAREHPPHLTCAVPLVASPQTHYHQYYPGGVVLPEYLATLGILFGNDAFALVGMNPYYNVLWQITENSTFYPEELNIPMLHIGGWFDHNTEDMLRWFAAMRQQSPAAQEQWLLMGPWTHGGTGLSAVGTSMQGELDFPEAANTNNTFARQFFEYYLLDAENGWDKTPSVTYFQMGDNVWLTSGEFPPVADSTRVTLYLTQDASLATSFTGSQSGLAYNYDPQDPSPTVGGKTLSPDLDQGPYDQSILVESRNDNLIFSSDVLQEDIRIRGQIHVHLRVSSDRPDTDIALRLTEVYPDGKSIALGQIIQRMRFRNGYTLQDEAFMQTGDTYDIDMAFDDLAHTFKTGNRIRLIITSSNYPWFNRNMNTGGEMYPNDNLDTLVNPVVAHNTIWVEGEGISKMILPLSSTTTSTQPVSQFAVHVWPNPASHWFTIDNPEPGALLTMFDINGQRVFSQRLKGNREIVPVEGLAPGLYVIHLSIAGKESTARICIPGS